jgi:hypothetical protein
MSKKVGTTRCSNTGSPKDITEGATKKAVPIIVSIRDVQQRKFREKCPSRGSDKVANNGHTKWGQTRGFTKWVVQKGGSARDNIKTEIKNGVEQGGSPNGDIQGRFPKGVTQGG